MRITNQLQNQMLAGQVARNQGEVYRLQEQVASGVQMKVASDNPKNWASVARLERQQTELLRYDEATKLMEDRLESLDVALNAMSDLLQNASEVAVQSGQGLLNEADRNTFAEQVDQLLEQLVVNGNAKYDGQYLFGGVSSSTEPFDVVRDADGRISSVSYVGSEDMATVEIGDGERMARHMVGGGSDGVLMSDEGNAFEALITLRDQLMSGQNPADTGVQEQIDSAYSSVLTNRAVTGAQMERLTLLTAFRAEQLAQVQERISDKQDVDVAEVVTELSAKNVAYEAVLAMSSKALSISLLNYI